MSQFCVDEKGHGPCGGEVHNRYSLSGSGLAFPRCDVHYDAYVQRMTPVIRDIEERYPKQAPDDFDPMYAGERWDEEDSWP